MQEHRSTKPSTQQIAVRSPQMAEPAEVARATKYRGSQLHQTKGRLATRLARSRAHIPSTCTWALKPVRKPSRSSNGAAHCCLQQRVSLNTEHGSNYSSVLSPDKLIFHSLAAKHFCTVGLSRPEPLLGHGSSVLSLQAERERAQSGTEVTRLVSVGRSLVEFYLPTSVLTNILADFSTKPF